VRPELLRRLAAGQRLALVTDAGTPLISDPGYKLVDAALAAGAKVIAIPGPSAVTAALSVAGLPTDRFLFAGFLPPKSARRRTELAELAAIPATLVFLESPRRLVPALADMAAILGSGRPAAVARELTKLFEEVRRATLGELAQHFGQAGAPKGEIVVIVGPPSGAAPELGSDAVDAMLRAALARVSLRQAAAEVAAATGQPRRQVYARALQLRGPGDGAD
jgi:16S rRNA (cytidine1402-2'-O)-methyltransferase